MARIANVMWADAWGKVVCDGDLRPFLVPVFDNLISDYFALPVVDSLLSVAG
jgi:hypothetical protein